jgi:hypothetical protein
MRQAARPAERAFLLLVHVQTGEEIDHRQGVFVGRHFRAAIERIKPL